MYVQMHLHIHMYMCVLCWQTVSCLVCLCDRNYAYMCMFIEMYTCEHIENLTCMHKYIYVSMQFFCL